MGLDGAFLLFAAAMVASPGPANMVLVAAGARFGLLASLPFIAGVALGKQLVIWPIGLGLSGATGGMPWLGEALRWISAAYIVWLAWRIAGSSLRPGAAGDSAPSPPGLAAGLIVHPLNPKAWAMVIAAFASFAPTAAPPLATTATLAIGFLAVQALFHPLWCWGGAALAARIKGQRAERLLMRALGLATLTALGLVLMKGP